MVNKKRGLVIGIFLLSVLLIGSVYAESCSVVPRLSCNPDNVVMRLSDLTNAQGQTEGYTGILYPYVLCCDFTTTDHSCTGTNTVLKLSGDTNAHAEIPTGTSYSTNVCFSDLGCTSITSGSCPLEYPIPVISLSSTTNAHLANFSTAIYTTKICCRHGGGSCVPDCTGRECGDDGCGGDCGPLSGACPGSEICDASGQCIPPVPSDEIYWADANDPTRAIDYLQVVPGFTQVALVLKNIIPPSGTMNFEIYEDDTLTSDEEIRTGSDALGADVASDGSSIAYWTVTQDDLDKTFDSDNFYFNANSLTSGELAIVLSGGSCLNLEICADYTDSTMCSSDTCNVANHSVYLINQSVTCGDGYICSCSWDTDTSTCGPGWRANPGGVVDPFSSPIELGTCNYDESSSDDCSDDGVLDYSWGSRIFWPSDNSGWTTQQGCIDAGGSYEDCLNFSSSIADLNGDDLWHYDPEYNGVHSLFDLCRGGQDSRTCPAQIELPFFTIGNLLVLLVLLLLFYIIYVRLGKKNSNKKKISKKVKRKKK